MNLGYRVQLRPWRLRQNSRSTYLHTLRPRMRVGYQQPTTVTGELLPSRIVKLILLGGNNLQWSALWHNSRPAY